MKAVCPNSPEHKKFITVTHEMHDTLVDENGDFIEDKGCLQVDHGPDKGNTWVCDICGAEATVTDD